MTDQQTLQLKALAEQYKVETDAAAKKKLYGQLTDIIALDIAPEAEALVKSIESDPYPVTQGNYARYMSVLHRHQGMFQVAMMKALVTAGAGQGLRDACKFV